MKQTKTAKACVIIPVYKAGLSACERIALTQCVRVLDKHPIWLVHPQSLDVSDLLDEFQLLQNRPFNDSFFADIQAYNRLMLSKDFYQAFVEYEFMLIHQLDAFVFSDELLKWCRQGYDYIGAPWLRDRDFTSLTEEVVFNLKKRVATVLDLKKEDGVTPREIISLNEVGNGGFSLRRVAAFIRCLRNFEQKINQYEANTTYQFNEDVFWGIEVNRFWPQLRIPDFRTALQFSVEFYPERAITLYNQGQLPFGCHAWDIHGTDYWRPVFARYGYTI